MSFLIDDILNSRSSLEKRENYQNPSQNNRNILNFGNSSNIPTIDNRNNEHTTGNLSKYSDQSSILHQTLLNRLNSPYYRNSDHRGASLENFQHFCYDPAYLNYYKTLYNRDYSTLPLQNSWTSSPYDNQANYLSYPMQYKYLYNPNKRKGGQVRFTVNQTEILEKRFCSNKYLSPEERKVLAESLSLSDRQVKTWFQNRRAKWRRSNSIEDPTRGNSTNEEIAQTSRDTEMLA